MQRIYLCKTTFNQKNLFPNQHKSFMPHKSYPSSLVNSLCKRHLAVTAEYQFSGPALRLFAASSEFSPQQWTVPGQVHRLTGPYL
ncbi:hypothetical protein Pmani_014794 [Petrolisthes manimaculis]|uniref:Uncharacterized protein n=1 Tax=Petrolisthes manimaculis TaxID=1843537 RepID=A0AAE1PVS6_9EUCA|nr:hypothetical protein Pmani_014794 [Petrolisthes manimaculis]